MGFEEGRGVHVRMLRAARTGAAQATFPTQSPVTAWQARGGPQRKGRILRPTQTLALRLLRGRADRARDLKI